MEQEPRKATDVLLGLEAKVNLLIDIIRAQDLNIKVLSNKLNEVMDGLKKQQTAPPKIVVEAVQASQVRPAFPQMPAGDPEKNIPIVAEQALPESQSPKGFRRNSRPETYAGDNSYLPNNQEIKMPMQLPKMANSPGKPPPGRNPVADPVITNSAMAQSAISNDVPSERVMKAPQTGQIPVMQRCVDKNGKSVFLADVEILGLDSMEVIFKTRTNGTGKWMATLNTGAYRVSIRKRVSLSKEQMEAVQDIQVDGSQSPLELPTMIMK